MTKTFKLYPTAKEITYTGCDMINAELYLARVWQRYGGFQGEMYARSPGQLITDLGKNIDIVFNEMIKKGLITS